MLFGSATDPLSLNQFSYVANNPVTLVDPAGLAFTDSQRSTPGGGGSVSMILWDAYHSTPSDDQNSGQSCSSNLLSYCGLWAVLPSGGGLVRGILGDACWTDPLTCAKDGGDHSGGGSWLDRIKTTTHGRQSLIEEKWTEAQYLAAKAGEQLEQEDGASVYIGKVGRKYNVIVEDEENGVITAIKGKTQHELDNLAMNYKWHYP